MQNIGIIGEGKMGSNIFYYLLDFGFTMTWVCSDEADTEKIQKAFLKKIKRSLDSGIIGNAAFDDKIKNTRITNRIEDLSSCDLIIEAIPENLQLKQELFLKVDVIAGPDCILATNSSSIKPSELVPSESRRERLIGLHFFYPVMLKNIAELIITSATSQATKDSAEQFLEKIKREYLLLDENNGFILNRIFLSMQNEAFLMVCRGKATIRQMDDLIRENFFPFGAFDFMETVGIPTMLNSVLNYTKDYPDKCSYQPLINWLRGLADKGSVYEGNDGDLKELPSLHRDEIISRLRISLSEAVRKFEASSGLTESKILAALDEYFGVDFALLIR